MIDSCYPLLLPVFRHDSVYTMMQNAVGNKFFFISLARGFGMSRKVTGSQARSLHVFFYMEQKSRFLPRENTRLDLTSIKSHQKRNSAPENAKENTQAKRKSPSSTIDTSHESKKTQELLRYEHLLRERSRPPGHVCCEIQRTAKVICMFGLLFVLI
jgi:hypothetical protein